LLVVSPVRHSRAQIWCRAHEWNLTFERGILENTVIKVGYVGSHGARLDMFHSYNQPPTTTSGTREKACPCPRAPTRPRPDAALRLRPTRCAPITKATRFGLGHQPEPLRLQHSRNPEDAEFRQRDHPRSVLGQRSAGTGIRLAAQLVTAARTRRASAVTVRP